MSTGKRGRPAKPPTEFEWTLVREYEAGDIATEIAKRHGVTADKVRYAMKKCGVQPRRAGLPPKKAGPKDYRMAALYQSNLSLTQVGHECGVSPERVRAALRRCGVKARSLSETSRRIDNKTKQEAVRLYASGIGAPTVAGRLGISTNRVTTFVREAGLEVRGRKGSPAPFGHTNSVLPTGDQLHEAISLYESGLSLEKVAAEVGSTSYLVKQALKEEGVKIRCGGRRKGVSDKVAVEAYERLGSARVAAEELGVSEWSVLQAVKRAGVSKSKGRRKYAINEAFFDEYTPASCYWAGFWAADGDLFTRKGGSKRVGVTQATKDRDQLERLKECADIKYLIKDRIRNRRERKTTYESALYMQSHRWYKALNERFNLDEAKTLTLRPPPSDIPENLLWHYVRGYFDGDGCCKNAPRQISFTSGSLVFMEWLKSFLGSHHSIYKAEGDSDYTLAISGDVARRVVPLMYANSTSLTRMRRKYSRFVEAGLLSEKYT